VTLSAVVHRPDVALMLEGRKRIEFRASRNRVAPYGVAHEGDTLFVKERGGPIRLRARLERVEQFGGLTPAAIDGLRDRFNHLICGDEDAWATRRGARYATLLWLADVAPTDRAPPFRRFNGDAWRVLREGDDGLASSP